MQIVPLPLASCRPSLLYSQKETVSGKAGLPLTVARRDGVTHYHFEIPFHRLGIRPQKGELFRMALLVNDNDGGKRLRVMEYFGGIEGGKNIDFFGWCILN